MSRFILEKSICRIKKVKCSEIEKTEEIEYDVAVFYVNLKIFSRI